MRVTTLGPALTTVTGTTRLFSSNTCVMPSLVPRMPLRTISKELLLGFLLDIDVDAGRQIDAHQGVNGLRRRVEDVDQPLVRTHLEVLPRVLVLMRGPDDAVHVLLGRQRHRTNHAGAGTGDRLHDLACRGVNRLVVVGLEPDADLLSRHASPTSLLLGPSPGRSFRRMFALVCRRCLSVCGPPVPAVGCVARTRTLPRRRIVAIEWGPDAPVQALVVCPGQALTRLKAT